MGRVWPHLASEGTIQPGDPTSLLQAHRYDPIKAAAVLACRRLLDAG